LLHACHVDSIGRKRNKADCRSNYTENGAAKIQHTLAGNKCGGLSADLEAMELKEKVVLKNEFNIDDQYTNRGSSK